MERRGHRFVRYADDALIFCKSRKSAERTLANIIPFIEGELFLKVNRAKTTVTHSTQENGAIIVEVEDGETMKVGK